jgi:hypothetical protein
LELPMFWHMPDLNSWQVGKPERFPVQNQLLRLPRLPGPGDNVLQRTDL